MSAELEAKLEKLYRVPEDGKAEIVYRELVLMPPTGFLPGYAGNEIFASLREYARRTGQGGMRYQTMLGFSWICRTGARSARMPRSM
jgi:Uma2 family endonuclease